MHNLFEVIYEDAEFLVVNKPAGLVCHPTKTDEYSSLISRVRLYLGPSIRPQLINRLDRETSGITVIAKGDDVARGVRRLWEARDVIKEYLAVVHGHAQQEHVVIAAPLGKDERSSVAIKDCVRQDGAPASTEYWCRSSFTRPFDYAQSARSGTLSGPSEAGKSWFSILRVVPRTGRKHQIRVHLAHAGHPIVGDKLYGGDEDLYMALVENRLTEEQRTRLILPYHALHAAAVSFQWGAKQRVFRAEPEPWFKAFCSEADGPV